MLTLQKSSCLYNFVNLQTQRPQLNLTRRRSKQFSCKVVNTSTMSTPKIDVQTETQLEFEVSNSGIKRLVYNPAGWNFYDWNGFRIHYVGPYGPQTEDAEINLDNGGTLGAINNDKTQAAEDVPVFLLIHGYGASAYHWRYNIPELAKIGRVYALDLLGYGWSQKAPANYGDVRLWPEQVVTFIKEVIGEDQKVILVGNSMGGAVSLSTAGYYPEYVKAVVLVNAAGRFEDEMPKNANNSEENAEESLQGGVISFARVSNIFRDFFKDIVAQFVFYQSKQPARIEQVLRQVYIDKSNVDADLIASIVRPTNDPGAGDVFARSFQLKGGESMDKKLARLQCPMLLVWGVMDPWMGPAKAERVVAAYPSAQLVRLQSGHCPHDESPRQVNEAITQWVLSLQDNERIAQWAQSQSV
eukprot:TRINITY_DN13830_c0_g1_i2.p1 TRINITY_DN13830_c0_g1~~TRINITY_DN13830_c0_g1_i2.p1  ORF type:complete len:435 (-),score=59.76 TRINITY_DN13830_c0_g1_i2:423-1661(-)